MKLLFFLVALANIAFFMWEYKAGAFKPLITVAIPHAEPVQEKILLVSELPSPPAAQPEPTQKTAAAAAAAETVADSTQEKLMRCYEVGAFTKSAQAQQWISQFTNAETSVELVKKDEQVPNKFMVYYPAAPTITASEANLQMLKSRGIKDLFILRTEKDKGDISLGVFSKEERAINLKAQMLAQGINVNIRPLYKAKTKPYILIKSTNQIAGQLDAFALQKKASQLTVKELFSCD